MAASLLAPIPFGKYDLLKRIGAGGMGEVWLARRPVPGLPDEICVLKKMLAHLADDRGYVGRFVDEGKVVVRLDHPALARVHEMGEVSGQLFMAMEYVDGQTLSKLQSRLRERKGRFPLHLALWIGARACEGLSHAHTRTDDQGRSLGIVHRDVSPANLMVTYRGELKVIDFGAALSTMKEEMTSPRIVIGNLAYMSPEHARKQKVDPRADLFSLGVVLWELLSSELMSVEGDPIERWKRAASPRFKPPSHYLSDVPPDLDAIVMRAVSADPGGRFPTAAAMREALLEGLELLEAPDDDECGTQLHELMRDCFRGEWQQEREVLAEASSGQETAMATLPDELTDPLRKPRNDRAAGREAALRSDAVPIGKLESRTESAPIPAIPTQRKRGAAARPEPRRPALDDLGDDATDAVQLPAGFVPRTEPERGALPPGLTRPREPGNGPAVPWTDSNPVGTSDPNLVGGETDPSMPPIDPERGARRAAPASRTSKRSDATPQSVPAAGRKGVPPPLPPWMWLAGGIGLGCLTLLALVRWLSG